MRETAGELGAALGVVTLGSVGTAVYRGQPAAHLPAEMQAAAARAAREGTAAAVSIAQHLTGQPSVVLPTAAPTTDHRQEDSAHVAD